MGSSGAGPRAAGPWHADAESLAALLEIFEEDTSEAVVSNHGQVVKMVGDEVLFVTGQPGGAAAIALRLTSPGPAQ